MRTIYKYPLIQAQKQTLSLPEGYRLLSVQAQGNQPCLWALVDPARSRMNVNIAIYGTGDVIYDELISYISTFQLHGGALVFHAFEVLR